MPAQRNRIRELRIALIKMLAQRDGWLCHYCNVNLAEWLRERPSDVIIEHKSGDPLLRSEPSNLVLACVLCNTDKANTPYEDYTERIADNPRIVEGTRQFPEWRPPTALELNVARQVILQNRRDSL